MEVGTLSSLKQAFITIGPYGTEKRYRIYEMLAEESRIHMSTDTWPYTEDGYNQALAFIEKYWTLGGEETILLKDFKDFKKELASRNYIRGVTSHV
jgi:hypothetical protein